MCNAVIHFISIILIFVYIFFAYSSVAGDESGRSSQGLPGPTPPAATATAASAVLPVLSGIVWLGFAQGTLGRRMPCPAAFVATVAAPDHGRGRRPIRVLAVQRGFWQSRPARETRTAPLAQRPSGKRFIRLYNNYTILNTVIIITMRVYIYHSVYICIWVITNRIKIIKNIL